MTNTSSLPKMGQKVAVTHITRWATAVEFGYVVIRVNPTLQQFTARNIEDDTEYHFGIDRLELRTHNLNDGWTEARYDVASLMAKRAFWSNPAVRFCVRKFIEITH